MQATFAFPRPHANVGAVRRAHGPPPGAGPTQGIGKTCGDPPEMYEQYWKLREKPFENDQNIGFFYHSRDHREALVRIIYAIMESKACVVLTGDAGCGKTYLLNSLARELTEKRVKVAMVRNPSSDPLDLLKQI